MTYYGRFLGMNGYPGDVDYAKSKGLEVGKKYELEDVSMGGSFTYVSFAEVDGIFNSVMFDFENEDGSEFDLYESHFNPY